MLILKLILGNSPFGGEKARLLKTKRQSRELRGRTLVLFILSSYFSFSQVTEGRRITQELCSSKYFGRGYVKSGDSLAAEFLAQEFQKRGLKPVKGTYFQPFSFDVNTFPAEMEIKVGDKILKTGVDYIVDPSSGSSFVTWKYKYLGKKDLHDEQTMTKVIRDLSGTREWNSLVIDTRNISGDSLRKVKDLQTSLAEYCHIMSITDEKFTFSVASDQLPFGLIYMHSSAFEPDKVLETNITAVLKKNHQARNVLAYLPAKKRTKKTIFITAHYDHLGGMGSETYFPGGNDNASGTSMLFTLADLFKEKPISHNIVFIAFAGEEAGLLGSKHYVEHPLIKEKRLKFVLNLDIMGSGEDGITVVNATEFPDLFTKLNAINEDQKLLTQIKKRGKAANSDHYFFSEKGFPAFFIYTMGPNKNYHDVFDTYEALSFNEYNDLVKLISGFLRVF